MEYKRFEIRQILPDDMEYKYQLVGIYDRISHEYVYAKWYEFWKEKRVILKKTNETENEFYDPNGKEEYQYTNFTTIESAAQHAEVLIARWKERKRIEDFKPITVQIIPI